MHEIKVVPNPSPFIAVACDHAEYYHGLRQKASNGLHQQIEYLIKNYVLSLRHSEKTVRVLDWGAGEGALSLRLSHLGFDVTSVDINESQFKADGVKFIALDFNNEDEVARFVSENNGFDIIVAVEAIEHIHDPWSFLNNLRNMCSQETVVIVTTPNVASWVGRIYFLLTGELWGFGPKCWFDPGHINPFTDGKFECLASDTGFRLLGRAAGGKLPVLWLCNWKRFFASIFALPLRMLQKGRFDGWVTIYLLRPKND